MGHELNMTSKVCRLGIISFVCVTCVHGICILFCSPVAGLASSLEHAGRTVKVPFSLAAYIPYPLIYGALIDGSCQVWESTCGASGNCWLYDLARLRHSYLGASAGFLAASALVSVAVALCAGDLKDFYGERSAYDQFQSHSNGVDKHKKAGIK